MRQLGAMLKKNFLLKRRKLCVTCCELLTPVALMAVLVIGYTVALNDVEVTDAMVYANDTSTLQVRACDSHVRFTSTAKHHQVRTKIFSPPSRCVPTYGSSQTGLCNKVRPKVRSVRYSTLHTKQTLSFT